MRRGAPDEIRVVPVESGGEQTLIRGEPGTSWWLIGWRPGGELLANASTGADRAFVWLTLNPAARSHDINSPYRRSASSCYSAGSMVKALSVCAVRMAPSFSRPLASMARSEDRDPPQLTVYQSCTGRTCARIRCQTARRWTRTRYSCRRPENRPDQHGDRGPSLRPLADVDTGWGPLALQ